MAESDCKMILGLRLCMISWRVFFSSVAIWIVRRRGEERRGKKRKEEKRRGEERRGEERRERARAEKRERERAEKRKKESADKRERDRENCKSKHQLSNCANNNRNIIEM
ncbi:uncharacterized protein EAF02_002261 [Botrytis sinoallii]|uniref:uncharacterized protein n=1 Tax=Botrytis sinoallii TaxID=1463999 RepID=UPI0018FFAA7B|nr:uncharacterized protein EAF02_002261 [Botrytis sinoallii]KAF7889846.1 hypothetical protein EAF02_002261 [Botrytis sinoallii]